MPDSQVQPVELSVTLEMADATRLGGHLAGLPDGRMLLDSVKVLQKPASGRKLNMRPGMTATLALVPTDSMEDWSGEHQVAITGVSSQTVTMEFLRPDDTAAIACRKILGSKAQQSTGGAEEYPQLLESLRQRSLKQLESIFKPALLELADHLFDLSTRVKHSSSEQNVFYDTTIALRRNCAAMTTSLVGHVDKLYLELTPANQDNSSSGSQQDDADHLDLVDTMEFESALAIERMMTLGEELHQVPLEALVIRLATLIDADPNKVRLPVHVRQLCRAIQRVIWSQEYPPKVVLPIFEYFTRELLHDLDRFYLPLNKFLASKGIYPELEEEIKSKGTLLRKNQPRPVLRKKAAGTAKQEQAKDAQETTPDSPGPEATPPTSQAGDAAVTEQRKHDNIYRSVIDALNFRRQATGQASSDGRGDDGPVSGAWDGSAVASADLDQGKLADAQSIAQALAGLQRDAGVRADVDQASSLREYLANNREKLSELKGSTGLTADSLNQLDLVDNLFGTIKSQLDVTEDLKPALSNLHIPLAKLALLDPRFFLDRDHPARATVDRLSKLATSANFPNKALEGRISSIVDDIVDNYDDDNTVFEAALEKIDKLAAQQERALSRNVERVVLIQEGQEKLHKAQQAVEKEIAARIKPPQAPKVLADLVDNGWRDLLVHTYVKEGVNGKGWLEHLKTLDLLNLWLSEQEHGDVSDDLLMQRGLEAGTLIDMIGQQITSALPTNASHQDVLEELRETLAGNREIEFIPIADSAALAQPEPAEVRAKIGDLPRLRRWVARVEQLEKDSWLNYRGTDGQKRRMQLAWTSEDRDRFIFVNERGQKVADLTNVQLARKLSRGMQPPAPADALTVVDQSLYQTLEHVQKTLSFARNHDKLTKLINRATFEDQLQRALRHAQRKHAQHALLYLNIDQFSLVNEVYDRSHGDQILMEFARLLSQMHGKKASSARLETDNFAVLLVDRNMEQAMQVAEKIRHDIENSSVEIDGENISFTVSIGVAPVHEYSPEVNQILDDARTCMHHAKEQGRNRVLQFEKDQAAASDYIKEKVRVKKDLEQAVANDRFVLRAQPIVQTEISTGARVSQHYELLLGMANKDGSLSSPEEFIATAERYGFMPLVDRWVVREAFNWISSLMDAQKVVPRLSINLSGASVTDDSFMEYLFEQISEFGVGTSRICFEITETGTISNLVKAADFVRAFRNIGCRFSIDDFGTGLASHNYLRELPVDYVKIDGSFVTNIHTDRNDYAIARSINDLAHFLGQETIAESVENDEIIEKLEEIGVDYLQGWGVGRPKLLAEVTEDLSSIEK